MFYTACRLIGNMKRSSRKKQPAKFAESYKLHLHLSLNRGGRLGTTDDFTTSFLHCSLFSTALWDLANSRPVHSLMFSSPLFFFFFLVGLVFFPLSLCLKGWFWPDLMDRRHVHAASVYVSLKKKREIIQY